jgi:hypothetical protein
MASLDVLWKKNTTIQKELRRGDKKDSQSLSKPFDPEIKAPIFDNQMMRLKKGCILQPQRMSRAGFLPANP